MVGVIYKPNVGGASPSLSYNEGKVVEGVAELVLCRNIADDDPFTISETFAERENNPAVAEHFVRKGFHATINPDTGDHLTERECMQLIEKVMTELGYGEQPYVVYRHNDIDREHYHIVSTRVGKDYKLIDPHREGIRLVEILRSLEKDFDYKVGKNKAPETKVMASRVAYPKFDSNSSDKSRSLQGIFLRALKFNVHNIEQLRAVLLSMNVGMTNRTLKNGKHSIGFYGMDENGKKMTTSYALRKFVGPMWRDKLQEVFESQPVKDNDEMISRKIDIGTKNAFALRYSRSREEYIHILAQLGVHAVIKNEPGTKRLARVVLVDPKMNTILDTDWRREVRVEDYHEKEDKGGWSHSLKPYQFKTVTDEEKAIISASANKTKKDYFGESIPEQEQKGEDMGLQLEK